MPHSSMGRESRTCFGFGLIILGSMSILGEVKMSKVIVASFCVAFAVEAYSALGLAQTNAVTPAKSLIQGEIPVSGEITGIDNQLFNCTPVAVLKDGDKVRATVSEDQAWSTDTQELAVGPKKVAYPILATVKTSSGESEVLVPAILKTKIDFKLGTSHQSGYRIEATRSIHTGQVLSVLVVGRFIAIC